MSDYHFPVTTTLCYILNDNNEVLLIMKKRGVGQGRWNGPGGKVDRNESIEESVIREVKEETGLTIKQPEHKGVLEFVAPSKPAIQSRCHIFITRNYQGELTESEECYSRWHSLDNLPFEQMWDDDVIWLGKLLKQEAEVRYRFFLDKDEKLERYEEI
jgi:mutator protein MutT